jgi:histidine triad (HIT) family protein
MRTIPLFAIVLCICLHGFAQSAKYESEKQGKLLKPSPFEAIISGSKQDQLVYQDEFVVAFVPLRKQAPIHLLIVPKKRIPTLNDATDEDSVMLNRLFLVSKNLP